MTLAYDANGYPISLPADARKWLVRKHRPKAPPQVLFRNGQRATLPIGAALQDLRYLINDQPGRYRLVALDEGDQPLEEVPEAYVEIEPEPSAPFIAPAPQVDPLATSRAALAQQPTELLLLETMRANTELARALIDRLPDIMKSSAYLLQAADGAGLPRRPPMRIEDFDDEDEDDYPDDDEPSALQPAPSILNTFMSAFMNGGGLPGLAKMLGAGGVTAAAPAAPSSTAAPQPPAANVEPPIATPRNAAATTPPVDTQAHLFAILAQLTADERGYAERVFAQLSPEAVRQWHELLLSMSVDEAVKMIRAKAAGQEA